MTKKTFLYSLILVALCSACSSKSKDEPKELKKDSLTNTDSSQEQLLANAKNYYVKDLKSVAVNSFTSLKNNFPLGPYSEFAEIKEADSRFFIHEFKEAAPLYEQFVKRHPASEIVPYALMMAGYAYQLTYSGLGRDTEPLENALKFYNRVDKQFPNSPYAFGVKKLKRKVIEQLAAHEDLIIQYYEKQQLDDAVAARENEYSNKWSKEIQEAKKEESEKLAQPVIIEAPQKLTPRAPIARPRPQVIEKPRSVFSLVGCSKGMLVIRLADQATRDRLDVYLAKTGGTLTPTNGHIILPMTVDSDSGEVLSCFKGNDLSLSDGKLDLKTDKTVTAITIDKPLRLIIIPD